jgi:hypothetical protein
MAQSANVSGYNERTNRRVPRRSSRRQMVMMWAGVSTVALVVVPIGAVPTRSLWSEPARVEQQGNPPASQPNPAPVRDARQAAPPALIGTWVLNLSKSKFPGTPPRSEVRTFDYTMNGMLLHTYAAVTADGTNTFGHWYGKVDGEAEDYLRPSGSTPVFVIGLKRVDDYNIEMVLKRGGIVESKGLFTLSQDGQTLTRTLTNLNTNSTTVAVWDRQARSQTYKP